jgi:hypothetical protein
VDQAAYFEKRLLALNPYFETILFDLHDEIACLVVAGYGDDDIGFSEGLCPLVWKGILLFFFALAVFRVFALTFLCGGGGGSVGRGHSWWGFLGGG